VGQSRVPARPPLANPFLILGEILGHGAAGVKVPWLAEYEAVVEACGPDAALALRQTVNAGIGHEREWIRFWTSVRDGGDGG